MAFGFNLGRSGSDSSYTETTKIDDRLRGLQEQNYAGAQGLLSGYRPTSGAQVQQQLNPYAEDYEQQLVAHANRQYEMARARLRGDANRSGEYGGSRFAMIDSMAMDEVMGGLSGLLTGMYDQRYGQGYQTAQSENQLSHRYPLARQGLLNSALATIDPNTSRSGTSKENKWRFGFGLDPSQ